MPNDEVASPCVGICRLDPSGAYCVGCFRTLDELTDWPEARPRHKLEILSRLPARAARHALDRDARAAAAFADLAVGEGDRCVACGAAFRCGIRGDAACWCAGFPLVKPSADLPRGCLCPDCLSRRANSAGG